MSYIDKLLQGQEVQWKTLGEVGTFVRGTGLQKKDLTDRGVPAIHYGQIYTHYGLYTSETKSCVSEYFAKRARKAAIGDLVIATTSENDEDVCKAVAWLGKTPVVVSSDACFYRHSMNSKYVAYFFASEHFQKQKTKYITGTKVRRVNATDLAKILIPVPPMSVQEKIVEILDKFTTLEAELEAELDCRKRQYAYYRTHLLDFSDEMLKSTDWGNLVQWKSLGEVCDVKNGFAFKSSLFQTTGLPIIRIGNIVETSINIDDVKYFDKQDYKRGNPLDYYVEKGDILIAMSGATTGKIGYYNHNEIAYQNQRVGKFIPQKDILNNRFLFHFLLTQSTFLYNLGGGGAQPNLSASDIKNKLIIPVPPMSIQEKIVNILDKFDTLTNSIAEGLPKEIELRRKQYEYYREQLLSF